MKYSLNEIEYMSKKAARGAGFEWGHAEEVGKAIRWLSMYNLQGVPTLASYLNVREPNKNQAVAPSGLGEHISKQDHDRVYCPILFGAHLLDNASISLPKKILIDGVASPLLLLPYLALITAKLNRSVSLRFNHSKLDYNGVNLNANFEMKQSRGQPDSAEIIFNDDSVIGNQVIHFEQSILDSDWKNLDHFAKRIYVPASALSRKGAGAEND